MQLFCFSYISFGLLTNNMFLYVKYVLFEEGIYQWGIMLVMVGCSVALPVCPLKHTLDLFLDFHSDQRPSTDLVVGRQPLWQENGLLSWIYPHILFCPPTGASPRTHRLATLHHRLCGGFRRCRRFHDPGRDAPRRD